MLLEFLSDGADECPLLRFYGWAAGEIPLLHDIATALAMGTECAVEVHQLPFINALGGITFTWIADPRNRGVLMPRDGHSFVMQLPREDWAGVTGVIAAFKNDPRGFNWLLDMTEVNVLLSMSGRW